MALPVIQFSEDVAQQLAVAGWSEQRAVNAADTLAFLAGLHLQVHPFAQAVMTNLGGLRFDTPEGGISWLVFDPRQGFFAPDYIPRAEQYAGERLTPVGAGGGFVLLVAPSGRAYLLQDEWFCLIRFTSLNEMFRFVFTGDRALCDYLPIPDGTEEEP